MLDNNSATGAVGVVFSVMALIQAVGFFFGQGSGTFISRALGQQDQESASKMVATGFTFSLLFGAALCCLGLLFLDPLTRVLGSTETIFPYAREYLKIILLGAPWMSASLVLNNQLRFQGSASYAMVGIAAGGILNIALDPLFIFVFHMGIAGAALATVIGQCVGALLGLYCNLRLNPEISLNFRGFRPSGAVIRKIYAVGVPSIIMSSIGSVMTFGMNKILIAFTSTATAVFGVYFKLQSFVFMPTFGLNNGMVPIISYNFGARKPDRMKQTIRLSVLYAVGMLTFGLVIFWLFTPQLLSIFNASETMLAIGVPALRIISLSFLFAGFCIITLSVCQALGHGLLSLTVSVVRQLVVLLPSAFLLARFGGLSAVWWAFPFAELFSLTLCVVYMRHLYRSEIKPLEESAAEG